MSTSVMPLAALTPFAIIMGLMLAVFLVTNLVEGYEPPKSVNHSLKRILNATGGWMGGFLVAHLIFNGFELSNQIWSSLFGAIVAIIILFGIDMGVLWWRSKRKLANGDEE